MDTSEHMFVFIMIFLLSITFVISFGIYSATNLSKYITLSPFVYEAVKWVPTDLY